MQVVAHFASKHDGAVHEKPLYMDLHGPCCVTKKGIDLRKRITKTILPIEIDEDQHEAYIKQKDRGRNDGPLMNLPGKYMLI